MSGGAQHPFDIDDPVWREDGSAPTAELTEEEFERLLTAKNDDVRFTTIQREDRALSTAQIERALRDPHLLVRFATINRSDVRLTDEQIDNGLSDPTWQIQATTILLPYFQPFSGHVELFLDSSEYRVRQVVFERDDLELTFGQIEDGLTDDSSDVRRAILANHHHRLTSAQIERAWMDASWMVREMAIRRPEFTPTVEQIETGLKGEGLGAGAHIKTTIAILQRTDIRLTDAQIDDATRSPWWEVRLALAQRPDFTPSPAQQFAGEQDGCREVSDLFLERRPEWVARREALWLTEKNGTTGTRVADDLTRATL